jgi:DNA ligase (NAD+)
VYDALKATLGAEYDFVPGSAHGRKVKHRNKILSLSKIITLDEVKAAVEKLKPVITEYKADGMTVVLYEDGCAVTRGDGFIGSDITANFLRVRGVALQRPPYPVRFETVIFKEDFARLKADNPEISNHRNLVAGALMSKDGKFCDVLQAVAITIDAPGMTVSQKKKLLHDLGYYTMPYFNTQSAASIISFSKDGARFEIDGLVIKSDRPNADEIFGATGHHPNSMVAYKYPSVGQWTRLVDVIWQVGRTGRVTPVAILEPVAIEGVVVSRATLHNPAILDAISISKGCNVYVVRANDVIPAITMSADTSTNRIKPPKNCPVCGGELSYEEPSLWCRNKDCYGQLIRSITHMAKREALNIEGLALASVDSLAKAGLLTTPTDLFSLTVDNVAAVDGFAKKSAENLINEINKARTTTFERFLYAVGVPEVGRTASRLIADNFKELDDFTHDIKTGCKKLSSIDGFGEKTCIAAAAAAGRWEELSKYVKVIYQEPKTAESPGTKLTFVITGTLSEPRSGIEEMILLAGHSISSSVSKKTSYVVLGENAGSKAEAAKKLNIPMIGLAELKALLK